MGTLVDFFEVDQACSLLLEVGEHTRKNLGTVGGILADGGVLANCSQEVGVSVACVLSWKKIIETGLREDLLHSLDI